MAPLAERLAWAAKIDPDRRIIATDLERALGTTYTVDTLSALRQRFPRARFVFLMGADNLQQLPRWHRWRHLINAMPIAVLPRPGATRKALAGQAARLMRHARLRREASILLARSAAPRWSLLMIRENPLSASQIRAQRRHVPPAP